MIDDNDWIRKQFLKLQDSVEILEPSEVVENNRYLPAQTGSVPGPYSFKVTPYWKEVLDLISIHNATREIVVMKGVQVGFTTSILENAIFYMIKYVKSAPGMLYTADADLAHLRIEQYIMPMLNESGLADLIQANDIKNGRKTGKTSRKLEWKGGGFLLPFGAKSHNKMRTFSAQFLFRDEIDAYPLSGRDGDPLTVSAARTNAFPHSKKIVDGSTPLTKETSKVYERYLKGDQCKWMVPCRKCGVAQELEFNKVDRDSGHIWGLHFETNEEGSSVLDGSVVYICKECGHEHKNADKSWMLPKGKWVPTTKSKKKNYRSFHLSALYSPAEMLTWEEVADDWVECWNVVEDKPRDIKKLQTFYNNDLGKPFRMSNKKVTWKAVSSHRCNAYRSGHIPSQYLQIWARTEVAAVVCSVDVQGDELSVSTWAYTKKTQAVLIEYFLLKGDTSDADSAETWGALANFIETQSYLDDEKNEHIIELTGIDAGHHTEIVYRFCARYEKGVIPLRGMPSSYRSEFKPTINKLNKRRIDINVNYYKERWNMALNLSWNENGDMPSFHFLAPVDVPNSALEELTKEYKVEKINEKTGQKEGYQWHRPKNVRNELWDLLVYSNAMFEVIAWERSGQTEINPEKWM